MKCLCALSLVLALSVLPACGGARVVGATPTAQAALTADAIVIRVNELQATVIEACGPMPQCQPGSVDTRLARDIVQACIDVRKTLRSVPSGWRETARAGWTQARARFGTVTNPAIIAALAAVDIAIGGL